LVILKLANERTVIKVHYQLKKTLADKFGHGASLSFNVMFNKLAEKNQPSK